MKLVLHSLIIFFGTLLAAGLVALGEPVDPATPTATAPPVTVTPLASAR